jgi:TPR repeat protein
MLRLAELFLEGRGAVKDYIQGMQWLRRAANAGSAQGQLRLGNLYMDGIGVAQDPVMAHMWLNLAAARANDQILREAAIAMRDEVSAGLSSSELDQARRLAREWQSINT